MISQTVTLESPCDDRVGDKIQGNISSEEPQGVPKAIKEKDSWEGNINRIQSGRVEGIRLLSGLGCVSPGQSISVQTMPYPTGLIVQRQYKKKSCFLYLCPRRLPVG